MELMPYVQFLLGSLKQTGPNWRHTAIMCILVNESVLPGVGFQGGCGCRMNHVVGADALKTVLVVSIHRYVIPSMFVGALSVRYQQFFFKIHALVLCM